MAEINGTGGPDKVIVQSGDRFFGEGGDDHITLMEWAIAQGGPGNDTLIGDSASQHATAWYWSSNNPILVDLAEGYALDGFGGRDTLINIHEVHGFKRDGDKGLGSALNDNFWIGPWSGHNGLIQIDGRGGNDVATIGFHESENRGTVVFQASADGRLVLAHLSSQPGLVMEIRNVETIRVAQYLNSNNWVYTNYRVSDLIDLSQAGQEILVRGATGLQNGSLGRGVTITYSFLDKAPPTGAEGGSGFQAFSPALQQTTRTILSNLQQQTGITFQEVVGDAGTIRFGINQQANTRGYSFLPDQHRNDAKAGDVWLDVETSALMQTGQEGYYVLLHELAHALGLQHPLRETDTSGQTVLLDGFATFTHTLMLDVLSAQNPDNAWPSWYGFFDLQALHHLYGSKAYAVANSTHLVVDGASSVSVVIVDDGGLDVLDISSSRVSGHVDMRPGKVSSVAVNTEGISYFGNLSIASGTWIENLVATPFDDYIVGNDLDNMVWSMGGNDILLGLGGCDTVVLGGRSTDWTIQRAADGLTWNARAADGESGSVELQTTERLKFADAAIALDTSGVGGQAYRVYKAAFNRTPDLGGLGFWISGMDGGVSLNAVAQGFVNSAEFKTVYGASPTNAQIVTRFYDNVLGRAAESGGYNYWLGVLNSGQGSVAGVLAEFSESAENQAGVIGVIGSGIEYTPYV